MTLLAAVLSAGAAFGQGHTLWQDGGVQLCGPSALDPVLAVSDSAGGAIVVWPDVRNGPLNYGIYAQRVDAAGVPQWAENGVLLCDSTLSTAGYFAATGDGSGGAIAVWGPPGRPFAVQRVSADGVPLWGANGLELRQPSDSLVAWPALVQDGHGGAIVVWSAICFYSRADTLIACRVDSSGGKLWETVVRMDTIDDQPFLCPDGLGGVIIEWSEDLSGPVRVQRVDSAGDIKWDSAGVLACTLSAPQGGRACVSVGESLFVVGWFCGGGGAFQHRAQKFDLGGNRLWELAGAPISGVFNSTSSAVGLAADDRRQSVWLWSESRTGVTDLFAQKLDSVGTRRWDSAGVWLGTVNTSGGRFSATIDGRGGAIVAWALHRSGLNWDIYAQHVDSGGRLCWSDTGLAVCLDTNRQQWTPAIVPDVDGGAISAWLSYQSGDACWVYAQRVADGAGVEETCSVEVRRADSGPTIVRSAAWKGLADRAVMFDAMGRRVTQAKPGVYFVVEEPQATSRKLSERSSWSNSPFVPQSCYPRLEQPAQPDRCGE